MFYLHHMNNIDLTQQDLVLVGLSLASPHIGQFILTLVFFYYVLVD